MYVLGGTGRLNPGTEYIGNLGSGSFAQSAGTNTAGSLFIGNNLGSTGTYSLAGGSLSSTVLSVGQSGNGVLLLSDGTVSQLTVFVGNSTTGAGTCSLSGNGLLSVNGESIGQSGSGAFTLVGGTNSVNGNLTLGSSLGSFGSYSLVSGVLTAGTESIGYSGNGVFTQSGGSNGISNSLGSFFALGFGSRGNGSYNLSGSGVLSAQAEYIGYSGTGAFTQSGGTNSGTFLYVGYNAGSLGTYSLGAGGVFSPGSLTLGQLGNGSFSMSSGTITNTTLYLGYGPTGAGTCSLSGNSQLTAGNEYVGRSGRGSFLLTGGTNTVNNGLYLGYSFGSGSYLIASGARLSANGISVGYQGNGVFTQTGGVVSTNTLQIAGNSQSSGTYSLSDGLLAVSLQEDIGTNGNAVFIQTGGTNSFYEPNPGLTLNGTYMLSGSGLLATSVEAFSGTGTSFSQSGGTNSIAVGLNLGTSGGTYGLFGGLLSAGSVSLALNGGLTNNMPAVFIESGGTANISGIFHVGTAACFLDGNGMFSAITEVVGNHSPGSGWGTIQQTGGTNSIASALELGDLGSSGATYVLSGSGHLSAPTEYVGYRVNYPGLFTQSGGLNTTSQLLIGNSGSYVLSGGTLQVALSLTSSGVFSGGGSPAALNGSGIIDLSGGTLQNVGGLSVSIGANSLLIVPSGFDPSTQFASYNNLGLLHVSGTTLNVAAGQGFAGIGSIRDLVACQGTISAAASGSVNLLAGLQLSGTGTINLGGGALCKRRFRIGHRQRITYCGQPKRQFRRLYAVGRFEHDLATYDCELGQLCPRRRRLADQLQFFQSGNIRGRRESGAFDR